MSRWRKKPVVVEAHQWQQNGDHPHDGPADKEGKVVRYFRHPGYPGTSYCAHCSRTYHAHGWIDTAQGGHTVCPADWIINEPASQGYYPCKPDAFAATYEPA